LSGDQGLRDVVRRAVGEVPPGTPSTEVWAALGRAGVLRRLYDIAPGPDRNVLAVLLDVLVESVPFGAVLGVCVQSAAAVPLLATAVAGTGDRHAADILTGAVDGRLTLALAATEDSSGSDLTGLATTVDLGGDELVLDGTKRWVTGGVGSAHLLVLARHRPGRHFTNFTWVLVPADAPGVHIRHEDTEMFAGAGIAHVTFTRVRLPGHALVGRPGRGLALFARHMAGERLAGALWAVALCRRVLADTERWLSQRASGDGTVLDRADVRHRLASAVVRVHGLRALCERLGPRVTDWHDTAAAALLKACVADTVEDVLGSCARLRGASGFGAGGLQEIRAQAAVFGVGGGVTDLVLGSVADHVHDHLQDLAW